MFVLLYRESVDISSSTSSSYSVMKVIMKCQLLISFRNVALASKQAQIAMTFTFAVMNLQFSDKLVTVIVTFIM